MYQPGRPLSRNDNLILAFLYMRKFFALLDHACAAFPLNNMTIIITREKEKKARVLYSLSTPEGKEFDII